MHAVHTMLVHHRSPPIMISTRPRTILHAAIWRKIRAGTVKLVVLISFYYEVIHKSESRPEVVA